MKVTISRGGLHLTATVSSMHLVPDKEAQLNAYSPCMRPTVRDSRCAEGGYQEPREGLARSMWRKPGTSQAFRERSPY